VVPPSPHEANSIAADHLADLALAFLRREVPAQAGQDG
jgi:hypothetical protein